MVKIVTISIPKKYRTLGEWLESFPPGERSRVLCEVLNNYAKKNPRKMNWRQKEGGS